MKLVGGWFFVLDECGVCGPNLVHASLLLTASLINHRYALSSVFYLTNHRQFAYAIQPLVTKISSKFCSYDPINSHFSLSLSLLLGFTNICSTSINRIQTWKSSDQYNHQSPFKIKVVPIKILFQFGHEEHQEGKQTIKPCNALTLTTVELR